MIEIDGSHGEGGGQMLRSSLALSIVTGEPFRIVHVRANRDKPGLRRQHLTAVLAAAEISGASVSGAAVDSREVEFRPGKVKAGTYRFAVGTAGSMTLVLQTVLPPLLLAGGRSELLLEGGTHNPFAPPFEFLDRGFLPVINRMGPRVEARLERAGFYPGGGGRFHMTIEPVNRLGRLSLMDRGEIRRRRGTAVVGRLPVTIAEREAAVIREGLRWDRDEVRTRELPAGQGPGNYVVLEMESDSIREVVTRIGERGKPAETVAAEAVAEAQRYLESGVVVGEHLADQLLLPMALAGGGEFVTMEPTEHTRTNAGVVGRFLPGMGIRMEDAGGGRWRVTVG